MLAGFRSKFVCGFLTRTFTTEALKPETTALYDFHVRNGGKIVNFGGYLLPVQYDLSISESHRHTRSSASVFDVSHMLQTEITGSDCVEYFESICTADVKNLAPNSGTLTVFTNNSGGILDDLIVTKIRDDSLYVVSNAAMRQQDQSILLSALENHRKKNQKTDIKIKFFEPHTRSLLALQGPKAAAVLQKFINVDLSKLYFMTTTEAKVGNCDDCRITRCGYTGEDGFEISIPSSKVTEIAQKLIEDPDVKLAGLGARDSLRLEAGLCLYGNDITSETTPIEASLAWLVAKRRRPTADFPGAHVILQQLKEGVARKRVGVTSTNSPPARHGSIILDSNGQEIGIVTSGCPSPSLGKNVAMGYIGKDFSKVGTEIQLKIREKLYKAQVAKMPFVPAHYYNKPK